jgi:hypothetical protein
MIAYLSNAVAESAVGRALVQLRDGPLRTSAELIDRVIPMVIVAVIVIASAWIAFGPQ